jgi:ankyrin repeat protein
MPSVNRRMLEAAQNNNYPDFQHWVYLANNLDIENENGITALMFASRNGNFEMVNRLINFGANLDIQNHRGETALMDAILNGHAQIMLDLIHSGANVNIVSNNNLTALDYYNQTNYIAIRNVINPFNAVNQNVNQNNLIYINPQ